VNLLLDTHIALWAITGSGRLPKRALKAIEDPSAQAWVSVVSLWEIAIKHSRKRLAVSAEEAVSVFQDSGFKILSLEPVHTVTLESLPSHHQDPFDRMLVAQAISEPMRLVTADSVLVQYSQLVLKV